MKLFYIAGPYRSETVNGIVENIRNAEKYAKKYWAQGYAVICPHKNSSLLDGVARDEVFLDGGLEILTRCDAIVMIPGWEKSEGSRDELLLAEQIGIEIIYDGNRPPNKNKGLREYRNPFYF